MERIPFEVDSYVRQVQPAPPLLVDTNCAVPQCNSQCYVPIVVIMSIRPILLAQRPFQTLIILPSRLGQTCIFDVWLVVGCGRHCWRGRNQSVSQADSERSRRPPSQSHRLEHHAGRHVALPTRTLATTLPFGAPPPKALAEFSRHTTGLTLPCGISLL